MPMKLFDKLILQRIVFMSEETWLFITKFIRLKIEAFRHAQCGHSCKEF